MAFAVQMCGPRADNCNNRRASGSGIQATGKWMFAFGVNITFMTRQLSIGSRSRSVVCTECWGPHQGYPWLPFHCMIRFRRWVHILPSVVQTPLINRDGPMYRIILTLGTPGRLKLGWICQGLHFFKFELIKIPVHIQVLLASLASGMYLDPQTHIFHFVEGVNPPPLKIQQMA